VTQINIELPDEVAQRARQSGRALITIVKELHAVDISVMSDEEVVAEVKAARADRRARAACARGRCGPFLIPTSSSLGEQEAAGRHHCSTRSASLPTAPVPC